jgi:hypothetical protein
VAVSGRLISAAEPIAFVDESLRPGDDGLYVVAGVVLIDDVSGARTAAEKVPLRKRRFHWSGEEEAQRLEILDLLVDLKAGLWSYECRPCPTSKQERARAKCLTRLLWDLQVLGVTQLVIESRGAAADRKDRQTVLGAIKSGACSADLVYEHRRPVHDPGLWLADALAGATAMALAGQPRYRDRLGRTSESTRVRL